MTVIFNETDHTYTVDGNPVPSITQLVAPLGVDFDDMDELTERMVDGAADRGTTMHAYLAHRLNGGEPEDFELPDAYMDYAESVELFLSEHTITPWLIEEPLGCADYAGTPDLVCDFDGKPSILDYKFVSTIAKTKVEGLRVALDMTKEWEAVGSTLITGGLIVRTAFLNEHPEAVQIFLEEYAASTQYVNEHPAEAVL